MEREQLKSLVKQAKKGNGEAFGKLYSQYAKELYRFALWYLHSEQDAQDAVQDACLKAYGQLRYLKTENSFKSWFFKILANVCRDRLSAASKSMTLISLDSPDSPINPHDPCSQNFILSTELSEILEPMEPIDRSIVLLAAVGGFTGKEIGAMLNMNSSTVRSRLSRNLAKLREQLT